MNLHILILLIALLAPVLLRAADAPADAALEGTWEVVEFTVNGMPVPQDKRAGLKLIFKPGTLKMTGLAGEDRGFTYKLLPGKTPATLEMTATDGIHKGKPGEAIFEIQGDTLRFCAPNKPDAKRPEKFESPDGSQLALFVLKRAKP